MKKTDELLKNFKNFKISKKNLTKTNGGGTGQGVSYGTKCTQIENYGSDDYEIQNDWYF